MFNLFDSFKLLIFLIILSIINCNTFTPDEPVINSDPTPGESQNFETKQPILVHYAFSPLHLTFLAKIEKQIYDMMGQYEQDLLERLDIIRRYRLDYEDSVTDTLTSLNPEADEWQRASFLINHPSLTLRMIQRYTVDLRNFYSNMWRNLETEIWKQFESWRGDYDWPSQIDLEDTFKQLLRLQEIYDFKPEEYVAGEVIGHSTQVQLTARHCLAITEFALNSGNSLAAGDWVKAARYKVAFENDQTVTLDILSEYWDKVTRMHGKTWNIDDFNMPDIFHEAKSSIRRVYEDQKFIRSFENRLNNYKALCRGDPSMSPSESSKVYCFLETKKNPYFIINPARIEIHSLKPEIIQIHDIFGDKLVSEISQSSLQPLLKSNEHWQPKEVGFLDFKTTSPAWISETTTDLIRVLKLLEKALDLKTLEKYGDVNEPFLHVSAFAVGGHYDPCLECEGPEDLQFREQFGTRMATIQFALEDAEVGGEIVFPRLGISIKPKKGSVLIFYNLLRNGKKDLKTLHGSCPVVLGHKWVASKFLYENANFLKRKCTTMKE